MQVWCQVTGLKPNCHGQAMLEKLHGPAKEKSLSLDVSLLCSNLSAMHIIKALEPLMGSDTLSSSYNSWVALNKCSRAGGGMKDFLSQWDILLKRAASFNVEINPGIQGLMLLESAGLAQDQLTMVFASLGTQDHDYSSVSQVLTRCLGHITSSHSGTFLTNTPPSTNPRPAKPKPQGAPTVDSKGRAPLNGRFFKCGECKTDAHDFWTEQSGFWRKLEQGRKARGEQMPALPKWYRKQQEAKLVGLSATDPILPPSDSTPVGLLLLYAGASKPKLRSSPFHPKQSSSRTPSLLSRLTDDCVAQDSFVADPGAAENVGGTEWLARAARARGPFRIAEDANRSFTSVC